MSGLFPHVYGYLIYTTTCTYYPVELLCYIQTGNRFVRVSLVLMSFCLTTIFQLYTCKAILSNRMNVTSGVNEQLGSSV